MRALSSHNQEDKINIKKFEIYAVKYVQVWREIIEDWVTLGELLVVHFEDVVDNKVSEVKRMLEFLRITPDKRRMDCMEFARLDFFKRESAKPRQDLYSERLVNIFKENIEIVNKLLDKFGHKKLPSYKIDSD